MRSTSSEMADRNPCILMPLRNNGHAPNTMGWMWNQSMRRWCGQLEPSAP